MFLRAVIFYILFLFGAGGWAQSKCNDIKSFREFYFCSLERHPKYEISKLKTQEGEAFVEKASQFQNPEMSLKSTSGDRAGEKVGSTELEVSFSATQLWTRPAQKEIAEADKKIANIESKQTLLSVQKELIKDLYRFRQIDDELELVTETINAFQTIRSQFKGRKVRGPEQEITLNLVELASSDYELKKNHLSTEKAEVIARIKAFWGPNFIMKKEFLPPLRDKWMDISPSQLMGTSFEIQKFNAENEKALAEQKLVQRESWPAVSVGPTIERATEGPTQYYSYGVNLNMTLPLVSINGGARKLADTKALQTKLLADFANKRSQSEKEILLQKYRSSVDSLRKSASREDLRKKHHQVDSLFRQGLAPGSLVIEAHRQITEYTESQHEHENSAIESYLEIKALTGESFEEIFK